MKTTDQRARKSGFTLLELFIAMAVMVLMAMMSVPNIVARMPTYRLDRAMRQINADLKMARVRAMSEGNKVTVEFSEGGTEYVLSSDSNHDGITDDSEKMMQAIQDIPGINVYVYPQQGNFRPNGSFEGINEWDNTLWIWIQSEKTYEHRAVVVWPSGQINTFRYLS
ncbi:MAG: prepilin-type N-terminal cleavage/methylation domain-containing protein [Spartobacteria bacterium]|nr:prepilin-type N-terminal cleavage/methylation domain-containing protein [Spartobacteria bacterium]